MVRKCADIRMHAYNQIGDDTRMNFLFNYSIAFSTGGRSRPLGCIDFIELNYRKKLWLKIQCTREWLTFCHPPQKKSYPYPNIHFLKVYLINLVLKDLVPQNLIPQN